MAPIHHAPQRAMMVTVAALFTAAFLLSCGNKTHSSAGPANGTRRILVDSIHAHNFLDEGLENGGYDYHRTNGLHAAFSFLKSQGFEYDTLATGRLDPATLSQYGMVFINLVSADLPPFTVAEINAIKAYVEAGGGIFFITDHTNCYYHAFKLQPLFEELGMKVTTEGACEQGTRKLSSGAGWIDIRDFTPHPVTADLRHVGYQAGGTVDDRYAIAHTSDQAWGDQWSGNPYGEGNTMGFYGNWFRDEGERQGKLGVIAARELGRGRIVVVADQNVFGDPFIRYADNYKLFLNSVNWLLQSEDAAARDLAAAFAKWRRPRVMCFEDFKQPMFGASDSEGFINLFVAMNRRYWTLSTDDLAGEYDLLLFADDNELKEPQLDYAIRHLKAGRNVVVLRTSGFAFSSPTTLSGQLAAKLGQPTNTKNRGALEVAQFKDAGRVFIFLISDTLTNEKFPPPTKAPTPDQQIILERWNTLIDECLKTGQGKTQDAKTP